ncbi:bacteriocin-protection protein [Opitutaceae bacterium EW11]|nr:bacteriocin-protection protein [Opitutaceae bacterium EW11]
MEPVFFRNRAEWRAWLEQHHASEGELLFGFHKRQTGKPSLTWPESVEEALCFGWIDGIRRSLGPESYTIRFTPRRKGSTWSALNLRTVESLIQRGLMTPAGLTKYRERDPSKTGRYSFERDAAAFTPAMLKRFKAEKSAWEFFQKQAPSYRKLATWWVVSAKREETRVKRLAVLIQRSKLEKRI